MQASVYVRFFGILICLSLLFGAVVSARASQTLDDPYLSEQWYLDAIHAKETQTTVFSGLPVIVAVLDAGFDLDHPDLIGQYWKNEKEIPNNGKDDDGNGFDDDVQGWDFVDSDPDPSPVLAEPFNDTVVSHGTVIAGIIAAAAYNHEGIVGMSPQAKIMPLRILNEHGAGSTFDVRQAMVYAVNNGAQVINLSFTSDQPDESLRKTMEWAVDQGIVIVTAVGNGNRNLNEKPTYPSCFDAHTARELVLAVAAGDRLHKKATFSNFGADCTDVVAPGTDVFSTVYQDTSKLITSTAYASPWEGTSIAAPMVSAAVAVLKAVYPSLTPEQVMLSIKLSVDPVNESSVEARKHLGAGWLNVARALEAATVFAHDRPVRSHTSIKPSGSFVVAQGRGYEPRVVRVDAHGKELVSFLAYAHRFRGGVSIAVGDVTGDGVEEIITGARKGGGPQVRVFDLNGQVLSQFFADDPSDRGGILVGAADTDGDGTAEIFVTPESNGTGEVKVFNRLGQLQGLLRPFGRLTGQIHLAFGNMDDDSPQELIALWDHNPIPAVRILDGNGRYVREFQIPAFLANASVASGDMSGDGKDDVVLGAPAGRGPSVQVYSALGERGVYFTAYTPGFHGGVTACVGDVDQNGRAEIYTTPGVGGGPHVRIFNQDGQAIGGFFPFDSSNRSGATCALWHLPSL
ncbi:S8 family serine peptidase [Candidatus Uhrbacteria bacterium]|nr:S8 family serine peptidase [Candidatus Uhrbacteria bacterium]